MGTTFYYGNDYNYYMNSADAEALVLVILVALLLMLIPVAILYIIGLCKVFKKAGKPAGFAFIPVYGMYVQYDIAGCKKLFWFYLPVFIVSTLLSTVTEFVTSYSALSVISFLSSLCSVASVVLYILWCVKLAKAFGKSGGFAVGLIFLPFVFMMILGCGKDPYLGNGAQPQPQALPRQEPVNDQVWRCSCGAYNLQGNRFCFHCGKEKNAPQA